MAGWKIGKNVNKADFGYDIRLARVFKKTLPTGGRMDTGLTLSYAKLKIDFEMASIGALSSDFS